MKSEAICGQALVEKEDGSMLEASYLFCLDVMRERATSFYQAFSILDEDEFRDIAAVYAFCRYVDDIADELGDRSPKEALSSLEELEAEIRRLYQRTESDKREDKVFASLAWWLAFSNAVEKRTVPLRALLSQLEGQSLDLNFSGMETLGDLLRYCALVAGSVGIMLSPMLLGNPDDPGGLEACENLGIAMQITNILRDIGEDLRDRNRIYIPREMLSRHFVDVDRLTKCAVKKQTLAIDGGFVPLWEELASIAERYYNAFLKKIDLFDDRARTAILSATLFYSAILDEIREQGYDCLTKRNFVSDEKKWLLMQKIDVHPNIRRVNPKTDGTPVSG